jgi:hypothetical protein
MRLTFGATGFEGNYALLSVKSLIDWDKIHLFNFTFVIDEFMESHLSIYIDGELIEKLKVPFPIFIYNDSLLYETFVNRSYDNETLGLNFGLCRMLGYSTEVPFKGRANLFLYFDEKLGKEELRCIYFTKGQYGYAKSGTNNLTTTNSPVMWDISELKQGKYPQRVDNQEENSTLEDLMKFSGNLSSENPRSGDNEQIDADLAKEYGKDL